MRGGLFRAVGAAVGATILAIGTVACGGGSGGESAAVDGSWDEVVTAANGEGSVTLYSSQNSAILESVKKSWSQRYPDITLEFVRGTDADLLPKIDTENRTGKGIADVHIGTDTAWMSTMGEKEGSSQSVVGPSFANPDYARDTSILPGNFFLTSAATFGLGWNTDSVPEGLKSPRDVLNPKYKGKIGIVNPAGIAAYVDLYDFYSENFGDDFEEKLADLEPRVYPSALAVSQALTSGEIVVTPMVQPLIKEKASGAPVGWALPDPTWGTPFYGHVTAVSPHPNAAQVLADFLVSEEGQQAQAIGVATVLPDIEGATANAKKIRRPDPEVLTTDYVQKRSQEWQQRFQR